MNIRKLIKSFIFLFSVTLLTLGFTVQTRATNINLGSQASQDMGSGGKKGTWWKPGDYGIRFTVVNRKTGVRVARSIDYFKINDFKTDKVYSTSGNNKLEYIYLKNKTCDISKRAYASKDGGYAYLRGNDLWNVISVGSSRKTSLKDIKRKYLSSDTFLTRVAKDMGGGITLEKIKSKENTLVFEPIYYFHLDGKYYALTATEIALYDIMAKLNGKTTIWSGHYSFSHKAIPIAAYLKKEKYGVEAYNGAVRVFTNSEIAFNMGVGMLSGKDGEKKVPPKIRVTDYTYRVDTDVYTSVLVTAGNDATPDNPIKVKFDIPGVGTISSGDVYVPKGKNQLVWVKWHTPKEPMQIDINATVSHSTNSETKTISVDIEKKNLWEPLNPKADDKKPLNLTDFDMNFKPEESNITDTDKVEELYWSTWEVTHIPNGDFIGWKSIPNGKGGAVSYIAEYDNDPYYSFGKHKYKTATAPNGFSVSYIVAGRKPTSPRKFTVKLEESSIDVHPASTASRANPDKNYVKSGYGISADISVKLKGNGSDACTGFQSAKYYFPEFNYKKYWRWGDISSEKSGFQYINTDFTLPKNNYSYTGYKGTSDGRFHFLPIWYPDGIYDIYAEVNDCWTPAGELKTNLVGEITCKGALWDDWHIQPGK